jgi:hypothetical protein
VASRGLRLSSGALEPLLNCVDGFDFALLVLTADDRVEKRTSAARRRATTSCSSSAC